MIGLCSNSGSVSRCRGAKTRSLLKGQGRYTDDINLPGQAYAVIVRSRVAHGILRKVDTSEARAMPGVLGVYTGGGSDARLRHLQMRDDLPEPRRHADEICRSGPRSPPTRCATSATPSPA